MIRPLFSWFSGRRREVDASDKQGTDADIVASTESPPGSAPVGDSAVSGRTLCTDDGAGGGVAADGSGRASGVRGSGREAGRREVEALEPLRATRFTNREEAALHTQLARAPRDINALFGLLEFHARRKDAEQVASFAHTLWDETDAEGALWQRAAALGRSVDPDNPLYSDDPFKALAEHAATQPVQSALPLFGLDLSLPEATLDARIDAAAVQAGGPQALASDPGLFGVDGDDRFGLSSTFDTSNTSDKSVFDFLHAGPGQGSLPASFAGLDLSLDPLAEDGDADDARRDAVLAALLGGATERAAALPFGSRQGEVDFTLGQGEQDGREAVPVEMLGTTADGAVVRAFSDGNMKYRPVRKARGRKKSRK